MAKIPVRITDSTNSANTSGGVAHRSIAHFDEIAVIGSTVAAANVSGGVVPLGANEYAAMMISAIGQQPAAWFRAGVGQTVTGSGVSTWADQSGNGRDLLQGTDAARPALQADGSVLFNGTSHYLKCNAFTLNQPETVYIAFKQVSWTSGDTIMDGEASRSLRVTQTPTTPSYAIDAGSVVGGDANLAVGSYGVLTAIFNGAASYTGINNVALAGPYNPGAANAGGFTLGAAGTPGGYANIQVLEVILAGAAHDSSTRARVIQYLSGRHGIAL